MCDIEKIQPFTGPPWKDPQPTQAVGSATEQKATKQRQRELIKTLAKTTWDATWNKGNPTTATHLRCISGKSGTKEGPEVYNQVENRASSALLAQLRTGHCGLNHYLWRFKKADSAKCDMCGYQEETVEHFLVKCPSFWKERIELKRKVGLGRMKIAILLGDKEAIRATMKYVSDTGRFRTQAR